MKNLHIENKAVELMKDNELILDKEESKKMTGLASIDKPWEKWYKESDKNIEIPSINFYDFFKSQINSYPNINLVDFMGNISYNQEQIEKELPKKATKTDKKIVEEMYKDYEPDYEYRITASFNEKTATKKVKNYKTSPYYIDNDEMLANMGYYDEAS